MKMLAEAASIVVPMAFLWVCRQLRPPNWNEFPFYVFLSDTWQVPESDIPDNFWWACAARFFKSFPYFHYFTLKNVIFHPRFQARSKKSIPLLRPGRGRIQTRVQTIYFKIHFVFAYSLLSDLFGTETINTFIDSRSFLENHTRCQTTTSKICTRFQTETVQKPYPLGRHILIWFI